MATARERLATRVTERIPHPTVSYAYLEVEASNWNEFEKLREDVVTNHPMYTFAAEAPAEPQVDPKKAAVKAAVKAAANKTPTLTAAQKAKLTGEEPVEETSESEEAHAEEPEQSAPTEDSSDADLSPREKARARLLAKKKGA